MKRDFEIGEIVASIKELKEIRKWLELFSSSKNQAALEQSLEHTKNLASEIKNLNYELTQLRNNTKTSNQLLEDISRMSKESSKQTELMVWFTGIAIVIAFFQLLFVLNSEYSKSIFNLVSILAVAILFFYLWIKQIVFKK